jgi:hypothetical protein
VPGSAVVHGAQLPEARLVVNPLHADRPAEDITESAEANICSTRTRPSFVSSLTLAMQVPRVVTRPLVSV